MSVLTTFRKLSGRAKAGLFFGLFYMVTGWSDGSRFLGVIGLVVVAGFAWHFYNANRGQAKVEPFPMPPDMRAAAEAMARPIDPTPKRPLPPHEKSATIAAVATTKEALARLIADKPPAWPWAVFASVLVQRRNAVTDRLRAVASGYQPRPGGTPISAQAYCAHVFPAVGTVTDLVTELEGFMLSPAFKGAFGDDDNEVDADPDAIVAVANRLMDYHGQFLTQAETCLQTRVDSDAIVFVQDTGMFTLCPLIGYERFITTMCARIGEAQDLLPYTGPETVIKLDDVLLRMELPDGLEDRILAHIKRVNS
ncbi:MAG: hypothetical protein ACR2JM_14640 [Mycobacterium sp.]